nr:PREDICTED: protein ZNF365 isoform X1 [Lepisosteus oculatus]XP_015202535.1 PREDICTED: protein ZNF365 isoform X1 [Lepisosteus oculatus]XP_015202536.1 PREDICTED: protein ZNF365 isoform X1 [Lepisosteus oculatus]
MQQKLHERNSPLCEETAEACVAGRRLPFRCPRCGEQERFRSLSSLRAHLEYSHTYQDAHGFRPAAACTPKVFLLEKKLGIVRCTAPSVRSGGQTEEVGKRNVAFRDRPEKPEPPPAPCRSGGDGSRAAGTSHESRGLGAADCTTERCLRRVTSELAQTDSELVRARARSRHLARERQRVYERERALSRQVDTAVGVIAALRRQLAESEQELERKEQEVISIHNFLEAAVQHEVCGKVRLQHFIENLLHRIALAEKLLEYYRSASSQPKCRTCTTTKTSENGPHRTTKARSPSGPPTAAVPERRGPSFQKGRSFPKPSKEKLGSGQSCSHSGLYKPDYAGEMWNWQRRLLEAEP